MWKAIAIAGMCAPLSMGLIEPEKEKRTAAELNRKCQENGYKIGTGFLTTWQLLPTLTRYGYADTAYRVLENTKQPGWLYEVGKRGNHYLGELVRP